MEASINMRRPTHMCHHESTQICTPLPYACIYVCTHRPPLLALFTSVIICVSSCTNMLRRSMTDTPATSHPIPSHHAHHITSHAGVTRDINAGTCRWSRSVWHAHVVYLVVTHLHTIARTRRVATTQYAMQRGRGERVRERKG